MGDSYVLNLGPCAERVPYNGVSWDAGDPVIQEGIYQLLPELEKEKFIPSIKIKHEDIDKVVKNAKYLIQTGTPSWVNPRYRQYWLAAIRHKKPVAFLGIGLAVPYNSDFWYGREELMRLRDSGLIDVVVCRDELCYYHLTKSCGFPKSKTHLLPCPGFYAFSHTHTVSEKKEVVLALPNPEETSCAASTTFREYLQTFKYLCLELEKRGATVHLAYHRHLPSFPAFRDEVARIFGPRTLHWFPLMKDYAHFHKDKHVYIGVRNHGALPCAGSGMPSLLLGTDNRQYLGNQIPYLSKIDIGYNGIITSQVLDWYYALRPETLSQSLLAWRGVTTDRWRDALKIVIERLRGGSSG